MARGEKPVLRASVDLNQDPMGVRTSLFLDAALEFLLISKPPATSHQVICRESFFFPAAEISRRCF